MKQKTKTCTLCNESLSLDSFAVHSTGKYRVRARCRACISAQSSTANGRLNAERRKRYAEDPEYRALISERNRRLRYGLTGDDFRARLASQGGRCAVCRTADPGTKDWHIDHDHSCCPGMRSCGACVRGLLCTQCNTGLGMFGDDTERLHAAAVYLLRTRNVLGGQ